MQDLKLPEGVSVLEMVVFILSLIVAVSGLLVAIVKGIEAWRKISVRDRVKNLEGRMAQVEARLSLGDKRFDLQSDDMGHLLATQLAVMIHLKSGNDHDKLDDQIAALTTYMTQRATTAAAYASEQEQMRQVRQGGQTHGGNQG